MQVEGTSEIKGSPFVQFSNWTGDRALATIGTNSGSAAIPFQSWRTFKEAFAPELIYRAVAETGRVTSILDPFGGSGTTALAAQFLGAHPTTVEVNPFLADLIEAKITRYDFESLVEAYADIKRRVGSSDIDVRPALKSLPPTFVEPGVKGNYLFAASVARRLMTYRETISRIDDVACRRLFRVLLAGLAISVSNALVSGKGRRYRQNWRDRPISADKVDTAFEAAALNAIKDIRRFDARKCRDYTLIRGDARTALADISQQDLSIFSPPYPNSFDYTDVYNIELWIGGYLKSAQDNRDLRAATLRSHVQIHRDMTSSTKFASNALGKAIAELEVVKADLWNKNIPSMISAYFDDMARVLSNIVSKLRSSGRVYMVVGDSRYGNVDIPVALILTEVAPALGFDVLSSEPFRSMRASPQQGGQSELAETLIVLKPAA
ncbi:hypothetical protein ELI00_32445 (plasmid) [Rhizobium ruizarguesonis]|uniref:hypothetical protein n=1 Tax=Rhizobium ruizarguesonis TaxID=2081791 RepID=UPI00102F8585|nr:hypothetical protein [Rhizobium ruizarguesonis]TAX65854.1 hypothetical protein ELI00_32445 [Rhizobium ruizarguesonis]